MTEYGLGQAAPKAPPMPKNMGASGRKLWKSIADEYELDEHERQLLHQACRTADTLDAIAEALATAELTVENRFGEMVAHPLMVEQRQQAIVFARLLAAMRLPNDEADAGRPQRRSARGAYGVRGVVA